MGRRKIIKKDEKPCVQIKIENEGLLVPVTVTRTSINLRDSKGLGAGDIIKHTRVMRIISITHKDDGSADTVLEIIKRNWSETSL